MSVEQCPVIHKVTDDPVEATRGSGAAKCPVTIDVSNVKQSPVSLEALEESSSVSEYKKLKRVMSVITGFYRKGTELKRNQLEFVQSQIEALDADADMVRSQCDALRAKPVFSKHRKVKEYQAVLEGELANLDAKRSELVDKQSEYNGLWEWSKVIVNVCEWLERNIDVYCRESLGLDVKSDEPAHELSKEKVAQYCKGLDEITYNLAESEDFFKASVDGRLARYHRLEREIVEAQLSAIRRYPEDSERRMHVEAELLKDLEYVEDNIRATTENRRRREKMLVSHSEYLKVLEFHKKKLRILHPETEMITTEFDSQYDIVFEVVDEAAEK